MATYDFYINAVKEFMNGYGWYGVLIIALTILLVSLVAKPIIKKILNIKLANCVKEHTEAEEQLAAFETAYRSGSITEDTYNSKRYIYERILSETAFAVNEKWFSDALSQLLFGIVILLCFVGAFIQYVATVHTLAFLGTYAFYLYVAAMVSLEEILYSLYEAVKLKDLFNIIKEKLGK